VANKGEGGGKKKVLHCPSLECPEERRAVAKGMAFPRGSVLCRGKEEKVAKPLDGGSLESELVKYACRDHAARNCRNGTARVGS